MSNKVMLITGASRGIGAATARLAARNGYDVAVNYAGRMDAAEAVAADVRKAEQAFMRQFGKLLPVSAIGETALHRSLGFDHRGRVDVALHPDDPEGLWLRGYLMEQGIPFYAFRGSLQGKATGAHIHIGPASGHYTSGT